MFNIKRSGYQSTFLLLLFHSLNFQLIIPCCYLNTWTLDRNDFQIACLFETSPCETNRSGPSRSRRIRDEMFCFLLIRQDPGQDLHSTNFYERAKTNFDHTLAWLC